METKGVVVGVDIGGTSTGLGFVDRQGRVLAQASIATRGEEPAQALVLRLRDAIVGLQSGLSEPCRIQGIGIGAPNAHHHKGTVERPVNLAWGESTDLVALVRRQFAVPVAITNDANAAAMGELLFGGARGMRDFIVITLGTGLGSGIIVNGRLVYGADGLAGELGHTVVDPDGRKCACGNRGCLETYVSARGLCRTVGALLAERTEPSPLREASPRELDSRMVFEAARTGDPIALAAFDRTARVLGMKLADAVAHTGPEAIFLFGGLSAAGELLLEPARTYLDAFLFPAYRGRVRLLSSGLAEGDSAVLGSAALIWSELG